VESCSSHRVFHRACAAIVALGVATATAASAQPAAAPVAASAPIAPPHVVPFGGADPLPPLDLPSSQPPASRFLGSPGLLASVDVLYTSDGVVARPCGTLKLGMINACLGALVGEETKFNVQIDVISFQSNGWEIAAGFGFVGDFGTLRVGVPLLDWLRLRLVGSAGSYGVGGGAGVEVAAW